MSTDWEKAAEETKFEDKPKLEVGFSGPVTIVKTLRAKSSGEEFTTRDNHAQLMVVFASDEGAEKAVFYCLGGSRAWLFARLVVDSGLNIKKMKEEGISFSDFENNDEFASPTLCNRRVNINIVENNGYTNVETSPVEEAPLEELEEDDGPIDADSCPF
jgi:hypothetical protein